MIIRTITGSSHLGIMRGQDLPVAAPSRPYQGAPVEVMGERLSLTGEKMPLHWEIGQVFGLHSGQPTRAVQVRIVSL